MKNTFQLLTLAAIIADNQANENLKKISKNIINEMIDEHDFIWMSDSEERGIAYWTVGEYFEPQPDVPAVRLFRVLFDGADIEDCQQEEIVIALGSDIEGNMAEPAAGFYQVFESENGALTRDKSLMYHSYVFHPIKLKPMYVTEKIFKEAVS